MAISAEVNAEVREAARTLWDYLRLDQSPQHCDCIIAMGSHDLRVAEHAAFLYLEGWAPLLVCSGGSGRLTRDIWHEAEAEKFAEIAVKAGVPPQRILVENRSANTGENILFSKELLTRQGVLINRAFLVHKPYMERRALATALKLWPEIEYCVSSPAISFEDYPNADIPLRQMIEIMVGDFQRILEYPALGYQIPQEMPATALRAYEKLVGFGYTAQMLSG